MQKTLSTYASHNRVVTFAVSVLLLLSITWAIAGIRNSLASSSGATNYDVNTLSRTGASTDDQIHSLQDQLRANPNDWEAYSELGLAYLQKVRETSDPTYYLKADMVIQEALKQQPDDYTAAGAAGALALARHQFVSALSWGERAKQINPTRSYAYGVIADAQIELGRYSEAVATLQTMVDLRPDMSSYSRISYLRELHGDTPGALDMMQLAVDSGLPEAESTAWSRTQLGNLYFNMGKLNEADAEYQYTLQNRPGYVYAIAGLGKVRAAQGRYAEAIKLLTQATDIVPLPDFVITLGDLYEKTGQPDAALKQYRLVGVIEKLYQANGVDLDMETALFNADHDINLADTVALARKAYVARPSIQGADVLAWSLYKVGNYAEAQKYSRQALELGTKDALKWFHAGMISYQLGDAAQAREYLAQAVTINPYFSLLYSDEAQRMLRALQVRRN